MPANHMDLRTVDHLTAYKLLTNLIMPRPIAWVTSKDALGAINLAPFSFFNMMGSEPPIVVLGIGNQRDGRPKHTGRNIAATKQFVVNLVTEELMPAMNVTAADFPEGHNEMEAAGLESAESLMIKVPRVAQARAALECELHAMHRIGENNVVIGQVVALYTADGVLDERMRVQNFHPVGRMGSPSWYAKAQDRFELTRISYAQFREEA